MNNSDARSWAFFSINNLNKAIYNVSNALYYGGVNSVVGESFDLKIDLALEDLEKARKWLEKSKEQAAKEHIRELEGLIKD